MKRLAPLMVAVFAVPALDAAPARDGNLLLSGCQTALNVLAGKDFQMDGEAAMRAGFCMGHLSGFRGLNTYYAIQNNGAGLRFCIPDSATGEQLIRVVVKYLSDHPNRLHEIPDILTENALAEAFPCAK